MSDQLDEVLLAQKICARYFKRKGKYRRQESTDHMAHLGVVWERIHKARKRHPDLPLSILFRIGMLAIVDHLRRFGKSRMIRNSKKKTKYFFRPVMFSEMTAYNTSRNHGAKRSRANEELAKGLMVEHHDLAKHPMILEMWNNLSPLRKSLSWRSRIMLYLHCVEQWNQQEIANYFRLHARSVANAFAESRDLIYRARRAA